VANNVFVFWWKFKIKRVFGTILWTQSLTFFIQRLQTFLFLSFFAFLTFFYFNLNVFFTSDLSLVLVVWADLLGRCLQFVYCTFFIDEWRLCLRSSSNSALAIPPTVATENIISWSWQQECGTAYRRKLCNHEPCAVASSLVWQWQFRLARIRWNTVSRIGIDESYNFRDIFSAYLLRQTLFGHRSSYDRGHCYRLEVNFAHNILPKKEWLCWRYAGVLARSVKTLFI